MEEVPFDIPESWAWIRLGSFSTYADTKKKIKANIANKDLWGLDLEDIEKGGRLLAKKKVGDRKATGDKTLFEKGDILYSKLRPYLLKIMIADEDGICTPEIVPFKVFGNVNPEYIVAYLKSPYVDDVINSVTYGVKMPRVGTETMTGLLVPLPPLSEQDRIIAKIKEVTPALLSYNAKEKEHGLLQKGFSERLKKSILQWAVQGKLVPQDPSDEPASVLLERIREEKARLVMEGKIKKDKNESIIFRRDNSHYEKLNGKERCINDEISFEIPDSWNWVRLGTIVSVLGGKRIPAGRKLTTDDTGHIYIRVSDMKNNSVLLDNLKFVPEDIYPSISRYIINKEAVYITVAGTIGTVGKIPPEIDGANLTENADRLVFANIDQDWLIDCLSSGFVKEQIFEATTKVGQPKLAIKRIQDLLIPLPPLEEQSRIVGKIDELNDFIKSL